MGGQTTTYTLDLNASLTQVLSDGTNTYLYGVTRIAQQNGTDTGYYLGDALNSVRQLTNSTGNVTLTRAYDPYGSTILNVGNEQTAYGYTGEYTDSTGLIYLRARMYDPGTGRFISHDIWSGDANMPMSYNAWLYGYGNPVMYVDPSGEIPNSTNSYNSSIQYDLTGWIPLELSDWVNDPIVMNLRNESQKIQETILESNYCDNPREFIVSAYITSNYKKLMFLNEYHGNFAVKDIKRQIMIDIGESIVLCSSKDSCRWVDYSVPGNILFGYIRDAIDAPKAISDAAGGALELNDNYKNWRNGEEFQWKAEWILGGSYGDNPEDYNAVTLGEELWDKYEDKLDRSKFETMLTGYLSLLQAPVHGAPSTIPVWEMNKYEPGHFNYYGE